ncbi:ras and Rab interactor 1-like, partial [Leucoraja erinacea]|uniref:ras and Rab interactor 1-like n=1 Tax=Leucoraja erinaceus TaxID=7782 RepID=UPI0024538E51
MSGEPVYDSLEPLSSRRPSPRPSLPRVSVIDRLLLTNSVWLQLHLSSAAALHILQRETPGIFLVRESATSQRKVLFVRVADLSDPSFVQDFPIQQDGGNTAFSLEGSAMTFGDIFHLISFYCVH